MRSLGLWGAIAALAAALGGLALAGQPWFHGTVTGESTLTGQGLTGGLAGAVATAAAVAVGLVLVFGRTGRRLLGGALVLLGVGLIVTAVTSSGATLAAASGLNGNHTWQWGAFVACGVVVAVGGALLAWRPAGARARSRAVSPREDAWSVLDRGADPTLDER